MQKKRKKKKEAKKRTEGEQGHKEKTNIIKSWSSGGVCGGV